MLAAFRIFSGLMVATLAYIWTVGQAGLEPANKNICQLANTFVPLTSCEVHYWFVGLWVVGFVAAVIFIAIDFARFAKRAATPYGGIVLFYRHYQTRLANKAGQWRSRMEPYHVIILGLVIAGLGAGWQVYRGNVLPIKRAVSSAQAATNLDTHLNLKFGAVNSLPVDEGMSNIARWYALANVFVSVRTDGSRHEIKVWNIFLAFEQQIDARQVMISSKDSIPPYEVKDISGRSVVIAVMGDLTNVSFKIEVSAHGDQLAAKPAAITSTATVPDVTAPKIKPRYNDDEIREMIGVMGTLRRIVDQEIAPETWRSSDLNQMWQRRLKEIGPAALATEFRGYSDPPNAAQIKINKILYDSQHYIDHIRPVVDGFDAISGFIGATRELANELDEYQNAQNVNVAKIVEGRFNQWYQASQVLARWVGQTDARITTKTKELREWNP